MVPVTVFQSSYRYAFPSFQAQWKIKACKAFIKNKLGKKQIDRLLKLLKQTVRRLSLQRPTQHTALHCPFRFYPFALSSLAHLPQTVNRKWYSELLLCAVESYGQEWSLEILGTRQPAAERWTKDSCLELCFLVLPPCYRLYGSRRRSVCMKPFTPSQPKGETWWPFQRVHQVP